LGLITLVNKPSSKTLINGWLYFLAAIGASSQRQAKLAIRPLAHPIKIDFRARNMQRKILQYLQTQMIFLTLEPF
jgi:hypothetical protein